MDPGALLASPIPAQLPARLALRRPSQTSSFHPPPALVKFRGNLPPPPASAHQQTNTISLSNRSTSGRKGGQQGGCILCPIHVLKGETKDHTGGEKVPFPVKAECHAVICQLPAAGSDPLLVDRTMKQEQCWTAVPQPGRRGEPAHPACAAVSRLSCGHNIPATNDYSVHVF